jgi:hypothetical protein
MVQLDRAYKFRTAPRGRSPDFYQKLGIDRFRKSKPSTEEITAHARSHLLNYVRSLPDSTVFAIEDAKVGFGFPEYKGWPNVMGWVRKNGFIERHHMEPANKRYKAVNRWMRGPNLT